MAKAKAKKTELEFTDDDGVVWVLSITTNGVAHIAKKEKK